MPKTIQQRIREEAKKKISLYVTGRTRSATGFSVFLPRQDTVGVIYIERFHAATKAEALSMLMTKLRCFPKLRFGIQVDLNTDKP
jgi:hypothetical protein